MAVIQGLFLFVAGWFVLPVVMWQARSGRYSWWLDTPDDPFVAGELAPHYGAYEESVRRVYARWGRYWGDVYWLGVRNRLIGLAAHWRPRWLDHVKTYRSVQSGMVVESGRFVTFYQFNPLITDEAFSAMLAELGAWPWELDYLECWVIDFRLFAVIAGSRIDNIWHADPDAPVRHPNVDGRPTFTFRSRKAMQR